MKKFLDKFGYVPKSSLSELNSKLAGAEAVSAERKQRIASLELELRQIISELGRHKLAHETLKEEHEKQKRVASKLGQALSSRMPIEIGK